MRKVFLDELPKYEEGTNKGKIDWKNSIGCKIPFIYDDIKGEIEIIDYNVKSRKLIIKYGDETFYDKPISSGCFQNCVLGYYLGLKTKNFKVEIGQLFKDDKRDLVITDREYRNYKRGQNFKWYKYICNVCGWTEGWIQETHLLKSQGCSCCHGRTVVVGINTIWDTARWMCDLGVSEEDAKKYTSRSHKKITVQCPDCSKEKSKQISDIYNEKSIGCICGDGFSYPEKFITSLLTQLGVEFQTQLSKTTFNWCGGYKYDFYLPKYNTIIEAHGMQHYEEAFSRVRNSKRINNLASQQEIDKYKELLASNNDITNYIVIDCRYSTLDWIKESVTNSKINELLDLSKVDWLECEKFALKNIIKEVCEYWNNKEEWETTTTMVENNPWGIKSNPTIRTYLKKGSKLDWCDYNPKEEKRKNAKKAKEAASKKIEIFKERQSLGVFNSCSELARKSEELFGVKLLHGNISSVARGEIKQYKGYQFKYIEENYQQMVG